MRPLSTPVPNLNGNSREDLMVKADEIRLAINNLVETIRGGSDLWHGRNFQTFKDGDVRQRLAMEAWHQRLLWLDELEREVGKMMTEMSY